MANKEKRSILIPYKIRDGEVLAYLQKREKNARRLPDYFGFFGGEPENEENPEEALKREIKEEMNFVPEDYKLLGKYDFEKSVKHIFIMEVDDGFENKVQILEGEYGKYFSEREALNEPKLIEEDKIVLRDLYKLLRAQKEI